ncbi:MAG: hypothetical protein HYW25_03825 [Candidatus Aenigmarchaeota archaeon]|nr:hypothetical protein [Candidatus Aenigmarchaeota archaeon]
MLKEELKQKLLVLVDKGLDDAQQLQKEVQDEYLATNDPGHERIFYALTKWDSSHLARANLQFLLSKYFLVENNSDYAWIERSAVDIKEFDKIIESCFLLDFDEKEKQNFLDFLNWIKDVPGTVAEAENRSKELRIWIRENEGIWDLFILGRRYLVEGI